MIYGKPTFTERIEGMESSSALHTYEQMQRREFEDHKKTLGESINDFHKRLALTSMGSIASHTHDEKLKEEAVKTIGETLTGDNATTTMREAAAYALGLAGSPKALDYLEVALKADERERQSKYHNTVRANAAGAVGALRSALTGSRDHESKARVEQLLEYVADHDRYDAGRVARRILGGKKKA